MNYYLFPIQNPAITVKKYYPLNERLTLNYSKDLLFLLNIDDRILIEQVIEKCVLPYEFSVVELNRTSCTMVICVTAIYKIGLPNAALNLLLSDDKVLREYVQLTKREVEAITSLMNISSIKNFDNSSNDTKKIGASSDEDDQDEPNVNEEDQIVFEEEEVLDYIKDYIRNKGYYFEDETLYNYHICLKTRPFVILAGLSGTGKSKLSQLYSEALGHHKHFKRLSVRPNWNDDRYLLGHFNVLTGQYITEPAVEFVLEAMANSRYLYSLCLDEMNLSHVEYYFSQFLSAMEEEQPEERRISLFSQHTLKQLENQKLNFPAEIYLPENLLFTGTINVDETTQPISDKVIDRANTIEFFNIDLDKIPEPKDPGQPLTISAQAWQSYRAQHPDTSYRKPIVEINKILKKADMGIGYRVVHEIELYLANSNNLLEPQVAFDLQIKQRILPRVRGTEVIEGMLNDLISFSKDNKLSRTEQRLNEMKNRLKRDGYTNFWR